jgi:hypothetical protein
MSSTIRPARRAAQLAAIRINEIAKSDAYSTDSDSTPSTPFQDGLTRARNNGYDDTIFVARYLLDQCDKALFEDERSNIVTKMFEILNDKPTILVYEPKFRSIVESKMNEFNQHLITRSKKYNNAEYHKAIKMMKLSMRFNVRNSDMRRKIYQHLDEIDNTLNSYEGWAAGTALKNQINTLNNTLNSIKKHPSYVPGENDSVSIC